jgi:hypothetical protein
MGAVPNDKQDKTDRGGRIDLAGLGRSVLRPYK